MKKIFALGASIAFLLVAGAVSFDKLPMGSESLLTNYLVTNITEFSVNIYQVDENGDETPFANFGGAERKFTSYAEFERVLRAEITRAANQFVGSQYYQPQYQLQTFFAASRLQSLPPNYEVLDIWSYYGGGYWGGDLEVIDGKVTPESVNAIEIQAESVIGLRFPKPAQFLEITVTDKISKEVIFHKDTFENASEDDAFVRSGTLYLRDKWLLGDPNWDTTVTVTLENGGILTYDGNGDRQMKLNMSLITGVPTVMVEDLLPNEMIQLQVSNDLKHWTNWPTKVRSLQLAAVPSGEQVFFRIAP